jgi:Fe-coproporphyrin III synthase
MDNYRFSTGNEIIELPLKADVKKIYIEVTTGCNYSCITCIRHSWNDQIGDMSSENFNQILTGMNQLPELQAVHFGGFGEPLSHPHILEMIAQCKHKGLEVEMITNGSLLTSEVANQLIDAGLDWLFVSLDGADEGSFKTIRPGASYDEVVSNIECMQNLKIAKGVRKPKLGIEFVATKTNITKLPAMPKVVDHLGAHKFIISNVLPYHESMKDEILYGTGLDFNSMGRDTFIDIIRSYTGDKDPEALSFLSVKAAPNMYLRTERHCRFVEKKAMAINSQGEVSPCYAFMHNYTCYIMGRKKDMRAHSFGNVATRTLREIWTDPSYARFRWMVRSSHYPSCTDCRLVDGCPTAFNNEDDCWGNSPSCSDCLWARDIIICP